MWRVNNVIVYSIGSAPIDLMLSQISATGLISVSWTPPPAPPSNGYRITVDSEDFSAGIDTMSSSQTTSLPSGMHTIRVQSRSILQRLEAFHHFIFNFSVHICVQT